VIIFHAAEHALDDVAASVGDTIERIALQLTDVLAAGFVMLGVCGEQAGAHAELVWFATKVIIGAGGTSPGARMRPGNRSKQSWMAKPSRLLAQRLPRISVRSSGLSTWWRAMASGVSGTAKSRLRRGMKGPRRGERLS